VANNETQSTGPVRFRQQLPQRPSLFDKRALAKRHLAVAERHVEEGRAGIVRQRLQITELESSGRASSLTAQMARGLLKVMQKELTTHLAERDRLRHQLNLPRYPRTQGIR
jgi:hypothetical protein